MESTERPEWSDVCPDEPIGPEGGLLMKAEHIPGVCQLAMERNCTCLSRFAVTCTISGMTTVAILSDKAGQARKKYKAMREELLDYARQRGKKGFDAHAWCADFHNRWATPAS